MDRTSRSCRLAATVFVITALGLATATARGAPAEPGDAAGAEAPTLTPAEEEALREALGADAADKTETTAAPESSVSEEGSLLDSLGDSLGDAAGKAVSAIQNMNPDLSFVLDVALAYFNDEPMQTGGHDPNRTGFTFQQLELNVRTDVDPFLRFDANIVFSEEGVEIEEAYGTTLDLPWSLQLRGGQILTRFGRINAKHPHSWDFVDQPLVIGTFFGSEGNRGLGAELSWLAPTSWFVEVLGSATMADGECCARSYWVGTDLDVKDPGDLLYTTALKQFFELNRDWSLYWGLSAQFGPNATGRGNRSEIYGTDVHLKWRPLDQPGSTSVTLQAEAILRARQVPLRSLVDVGTYAQIVWEIDQSWSVGGRYESLSGVEDDYLEPEVPPGADPTRHRVALMATYHPSHFSRLRLQASMDAPQWRPSPIYAAVVTVELVTGAHGAHDY